MSEPKKISPLLDGYSLGEAISDHDGVSCSPAVKDNSQNKYIVKMISIPASQTQLDALLLTGAYKDPGSAMAYFKELTDGVLTEAELLKKLSKLDGFLPYDSWQVVPMERNRLGYEIYLISDYRRSLDRFMKRHTMTHLGAVNLGLDMCAALAIARRAGWIYVDLKPSNIFITGEREYRIGDLGFMQLDSLKYTSLPRKYCSPYSAPEAQDVMHTLNDTVDTYSVGMLLYQIYNNGQLPREDHPSDEPLDPPANADYEMAEIILKACAPLPKDRWNDPTEMGQALVAYMQRNSINDVPITAPLGIVPGSYTPETLLDETLPGEQDAIQEDLSEEMSSMVSQADDLITHEIPDPVAVPEPTSIEQLHTMLEEPVPEAPASEMEPLIPQEPEEVSQEHQHAEESEPAVIPPIPEPEPDPIVNLDVQRRKRSFKRAIASLLWILVLAGLAYGGYWYYRNIYQLPIDALEVTPADGAITVTLDTDVDNSLLKVVCTDIYGNQDSQDVVDNQVSFTGLIPDMLYKIRVEAVGFHSLTGSVTHEYMTAAETNVVSFTAVAGPVDGSVLLTFVSEGVQNDEWNVIYGTEGEAEQTLAFTGNSVSISGLTVGASYNFRLESQYGMQVTGQTALSFTASKLVVAENVRVSAGADGTLTVSWDAPADTAVENWSVHCYSSDGYDNIQTVTDLTATFQDISTGSAYTVEILASGMTQPARANVTANPATVTSVSVNAEDPMKLKVSWEYEGSAPGTGWILLYTIDGSNRQDVVRSDSNTATIELRVPGAAYDMVIQAADGSSVFNNTFHYDCPQTEFYRNNDAFFYANTLETNLLRTPGSPNWSYKSVGKRDFKDSFASGEPISVLLHHPGKFYLRRFDTTILYVIRNAEGKVISEHLATQEQVWRSLWENTDYRYCELDIPSVPTAPGEYTLDLYFNGYTAASVSFSITQ